MKLYCTKCNFRIEKSYMPLKCPYCNRENALQVVKTAQDFLREINDEEQHRESFGK